MRKSGIVLPVNLLDVYAYQGEQAVKFMVDPGGSMGIDRVDVRMTNSDGLPMTMSFKRWGTKLNIMFTIDQDTPDGVAIIDVLLHSRTAGDLRERFSLWIIK